MTRQAGPSIEITSGGIVEHRAIVRSAGRAIHADSSNPLHVDAVEGISYAAAAADEIAFVVVFGLLHDPAWSWTVGRPVYFGADGVLTQTLPAVGRPRSIAMAVAADEIFVNVQPSDDREQTLQLPFGFGDASPETIGVVPADALITQVDLHLTTAFNGSNPSLQIGRAEALGELLPTSACDPTDPSTYQSNVDRRYVADTTLLLSITPGAGATAGAGLVVVTYQR